MRTRPTLRARAPYGLIYGREGADVINGHACHERGCPNASHTLDDDA